MSDKIILESDDEAAKYTTVTGWLSRSGRFYFEDERTARFDGATHKKCECGNIVEINSYCDVCHKARKEKELSEMPSKPWDGETPLVVFDTDKYFFSDTDIDDHLEEHPEDRDRLIFCEPNKAHVINPVDIYEDIIPDDFDVVPDDIKEAFDELNKRLAECAPVSWSQGKVRAII